MQTATNQNHYVRGVVVFAMCLLSVFALPYLGVLLGDLFFFAPQLLFPYDAFVVREEHNSRLVFGHSTALTLTILQWTLAGIVFAWLTRRLTIGRVILAAVVTIVAVGVITLVAFRLFGVTLELDGL